MKVPDTKSNSSTGGALRRLARRLIMSIRRRPYRWAVGAVVVVIFLFGLPDPAPTIFTKEEIARLNAGERIPLDRFAAYDQVCLYAPQPPIFRYGGDICEPSVWGRVGLVQDGVCKMHSVRGLKANVYGNYLWDCKSPGEAFDLQVWYAEPELVFAPIALQ